MTDEELRRALDGLYAYDMGAVSSGTHDEDLRERCVQALAGHRGDDPSTWRIWLGRLVREMWLSDEALMDGYGCEDAAHFLEWLEDYMGTPLPG
jgi:hypothetical protein